jgi:hypothetical protein
MDVLSFCDASTIITLAHCDAVRRGHPRHQQSQFRFVPITVETISAA